MMLKGSRYEGLKCYRYQDEKGRNRSVMDIRPPVTLDAFKDGIRKYLKKAKYGDYLDTIAIMSGANREELWYIIADINDIEKPLNIPSNTLLKMPEVSDFLRF